jgi:hypothetical protein
MTEYTPGRTYWTANGIEVEFLGQCDDRLFAAPLIELDLGDDFRIERGAIAIYTEIFDKPPVKRQDARVEAARQSANEIINDIQKDLARREKAASKVAHDYAVAKADTDAKMKALELCGIDVRAFLAGEFKWAAYVSVNGYGVHAKIKDLKFNHPDLRITPKGEVSFWQHSNHGSYDDYFGQGFRTKGEAEAHVRDGIAQALAKGFSRFRGHGGQASAEATAISWGVELPAEWIKARDEHNAKLREAEAEKLRKKLADLGSEQPA